VNPKSPVLRGVFRVDARTGDTKLVGTRPPDDPMHFCQLLPDGRSLVYVTGWNVIVHRDLQTGHERTLFDASPTGSLTSVAVSPDGSRVAFRNRVDPRGALRQLTVITLGDGKVATVGPRLEAWVNSPAVPIPDETVAWSHDSRYLIYADQTGPTRTWELWRTPIAGGPPERLGVVLPAGIAFSGLSVAPDGRHLAMGLERRELAQVFVLEHLVSPPVADPRTGVQR
jgi:Tol biopolymer transport system component